MGEPYSVDGFEALVKSAEDKRKAYIQALQNDDDAADLERDYLLASASAISFLLDHRTEIGLISTERRLTYSR